MSWLSKMVNKARSSTDSLGEKVGLNATQRKYLRYGAASMGGGMGIQYEYSRNKGMNSDEATKNAVSGGAQYSEARGMQKARVAEDAQQQAEATLQRRQAAEEARARGQIAARVRRGGTGGQPRAGTMATSPGGLGTTGNFGSFAALLGL